MSLDVALQSVAFYVLSCSTCAKINHRRKAKAQAKRERAEKHALETEQPGLYRHPSPFSTNPFWTEEIMMGPGPPKQKNDKGNNKNSCQRAINTAGSSIAGSTVVSTDPSSSPTLVAEGSRISGEGWNRKRYQREDEALWGIDLKVIDLKESGQKIKDAIAKAGSSAGRFVESRLSKSGPLKEENDGPYYLQAKNPPVNDLHPPIVSTRPASKDEYRWMLQPPPAAKIMEGKVRVTRSRASSNGSTQPALSRQLTERLMDDRLQPMGETPSRATSRTHSTRSRRPRGQRRESNRSRSPGWSSDDSIDVKRTKRRPPPLSLPTSNGNTSGDTIEHIPIPSKSASTTSEMKEHSGRPGLSTITSSSGDIPKRDIDVGLAPLRQLSARSTNTPLVSRDPSPNKRLSPNANAMPASIPSKDSKQMASSEVAFPKRVHVENTVD